MTFNPRTEALALRIYNHCTPLGWDCTSADVAEALDVSWQRVSSVCRIKGWTERLRGTKAYMREYGESRLPHRLSAHDLGRML